MRVEDKKLSLTMCDKIRIKTQKGQETYKSCDDLLDDNGTTLRQREVRLESKIQALELDIKHLSGSITHLIKRVEELESKLAEYISVEEAI